MGRSTRGTPVKSLDRAAGIPGIPEVIIANILIFIIEKETVIKYFEFRKENIVPPPVPPPGKWVHGKPVKYP